MKEAILRAVKDGVSAVQQLQSTEAVQFIESVSRRLAEAFSQGNKLIIAGNGGSLCDAMHFGEELTGFFRGKRKALPAIALSCPGHLTCTSNDLGFEEVFSRGIEAYGQKGDIFVGLTTSGNSPNIVRAIERAKELQLITCAFLGKGGGKLKGVADYELTINHFNTSDRVQEAHMLAIHIIIEMVEKVLFE
ncbi:MAG: SIS domain-containing protein [Verrucomicrobia bacterium]|nr:SIS domain-containing protein [Verrucomicrobiota bacterium]